MFRHIAIEGPTGVGKSALAERLATRLDATLDLEDTREPVSRRLLRRAAGCGASGAALLPPQPPSAAERPRSGRPFQPADGQRLSLRQGQDLRISESRRQRAVHLPAALRSARRATWSPPDLVVYLQAPTEVLLKRGYAGARRSRAMRDASMPDEQYLQELNEAYHHFFFHYAASPLLVVETSQFAPASSDECSTTWSGRSTTHGQGHALLRAAHGLGASRRPDSLTAARQPSKLAGHGLVQEDAASRSSRAGEGQPGSGGPLGQVPGCPQVDLQQGARGSLQVCPKCAHHFRMAATDRLRMLFDGELDASTTRAWARSTRSSSPTPSRTRAAAGHARRPPG